MSELPPIGAGPAEASRGPRRGSVTLREGAGVPRGAASLDPAQQSLADALRITFRLLQLAMAVLGVLFLLSGFQSIREGQRGIRLLFGRVDGADLPPGFRFSLPYPVGELIRVDVNPEPLRLDESFWPKLRENERAMPIDQLARARRFGELKPGEDGALLTADGNLAHAQWQVVYQRQSPSLYAENILDPQTEQRIVRAAVERGVVQAVAGIGIDDLLKQSADDRGSVAARAQATAQEMLDRLDSGLVIRQLALTQRMAPLAVYENFTRVQTAAAEAGKKRQEAEAEARQTLYRVAGGATPHLVGQIARYERAVELADIAEQAAALAAVEKLLTGETVALDGQDVGNVVAGEVTQIVSEARRQAYEAVTAAQGRLALFLAKSEQFRTNPLVMVQGDWAEAMSKFLARESVQVMIVPPGLGTLEVILNRDPDLQRAQETARKKREADAALEERMRLHREESYRQERGVQAGSGE